MSVDISSVDIFKEERIMKPLSESTYLVLLALYQEPLHGYGIIKMIDHISGGTFIIAPGTLYGILTNLVKQQYIETLSEEKDSRKKKTYLLTDIGKDALLNEFNRYKTMVDFSNQILAEGKK